jgi:hypothetical protein
MNQSTALGPALARRSHGVSVPGAPMRATFSMRALPPAVARSGVHVSHSPGSVLGRRTLFDGSTDGRASVQVQVLLWQRVVRVTRESRYQARPVESLTRDGRFPVGLPTGHFASRASLRNSPPARLVTD